MQKILQLVVFITFFSFSFLLILNPHVLAEPEMEHVPHHEHDHHHHDHNHGKGAFDEEHYHEGKHNPDADRKVILGSENAVHDFDELSPEESKKRLRVLAKRMDIDGDGFVTMEELIKYVKNSLISMDDAETKERFDEVDKDKNNMITWEEYLKEAFGVESDKDIIDPDDKKLYEEDKRYFEAADLNKDNALTLEEFSGFQNPEYSEHMHQTLVENTLNEKDVDKDGKIDFKEYMGGETNMDPKSEWVITEKTHFEEYDKDKDSFLIGDEIRAWLVPDLTETARKEAEHLIEEADTDKDGKLSIDEAVEAYKVFMDSEATNYGQHLKDIHHEEL